MPAPDQPAQRPSLPDGWESESFDVWAALESAGAPEAPTGPAVPGGADPSVLTGPVQRLVEFLNRQPQPAAATPIPDPLGFVLALLDRPGAPADWVPTEVLALAMGRVTDPQDALARRRASEQLGKDLTLQCPGLSTDDIPRRFDSKRRRGFRVADLRAAGERLREAG